MVTKKASLAIELAFSAVLLAAFVTHAQTAPPAPSSSPAAATGSAAPASPTAAPLTAQTPPQMTVPLSSANRFEYGESVASLPLVVKRQWSPAVLVAPESVISPQYIRSIDRTSRRLTLKQVIYEALRNNPNVKVAELSPVAATEGVRIQNGVFDPDLTATLDEIKNVAPITTPIETVNASSGLASKNYDWNFQINKVLATTNGTLSATFNNDRMITNNLTESINPSYTPTLAVSLSQPLLRNFGWKFATINLDLAESTQKQAQWNYEQSLTDFVQRVANDYWATVLGAENLAVAQEALRFNRDLVRQNTIALRVGTLAPLDLQEAQSAAATAEANVYTAQAALESARAVLREDAMLNPSHTFVPQAIEPADRPNAAEHVELDEPHALELAVEYRPSLGAMREAIRSALLQVRFQDNQLLPQVNVLAQFATDTTAGNTLCGPTFNAPGVVPNCAIPPATTLNGFQMPFSGTYGTALNNLFNFGFYNYAIVLTYERPLSNVAARAALAQARIGFEQLRMQYRAALAQAVAEVQSALANVRADVARVRATSSATNYARQALHDEQVRFRVGMATTHDLLQFQSEYVTAEGNQVQTEVDLENAKLALHHAKGTLLRAFQIDFQLKNPEERPWYAKF